MDYDLFIDGDDEWNKVASAHLGIPIEKFARKTAKDPVQEHLRQRKDDWNKYVKKFIATLISVKKGINGKDVPEIGVKGSKLTEPLPSRLADLLSYLSSEFEKVTSEGKQIVQEQGVYSTNFQEKKKKTAPPMEKGASNRLSRLWTYTKMPFQFSDKERWIRKDLLVASVQIEKLIEELDDAVLSKSRLPEAISLAQRIYTFIDNDIIAVSKKLKDISIKNILQEKPKDDAPEESKPAEIIETSELSKTEPVPDTLTDIKQMEKDVDNFIGNRSILKTKIKKIPPELNLLFKEVDIYIPSFNKAVREKNLEEIAKNYNRIKEKYKAVQEWLDKYNKSETADLNKMAASAIGRWMKRQRRSLFKNRMDSLVLNISDHLSSALKAINALQDLAERKGLSYIDLDEKTKALTEHLGQAYSLLLSSANIYNSEVRTDKDKGTRPIQEGEIRKLRQMVLTWGGDVR